MVDGFSLEEQKKNNKWKIILIASTVLIIAIIAGLGIYNSPQNRIDRYLTLGNKYLEEQKYEEAILEFAKVIEIEERTLEAYIGTLNAYIAMDNKDKLQDFYEKLFSVIAGFDDEFLHSNIETIVDIYMYVPEVFKDTKKIIDILEEGLEKTNQDENIVNSLVEEYLDLIQENPANYDKQLIIYDRILELTGNRTEIIEKLEACLNKYINILLIEKNHDRIRELAEKYQNIAKNIDFQKLLDEITALELVEKERQDFMQQIYVAMQAEDYGKMLELSASSQVDEIMQNMQDNRYVYFPDGAEEGVGVGIHKDADDTCNIYYGKYIENMREGNGKVFFNRGNGRYCISDMEWKDDAPNGYGEIRLISSYETCVARGSYLNGVEHGTMSHEDSFDVFQFKINYTSKNGIPVENKTDEFLTVSPNSKIPENHYVYAYDIWTGETGDGIQKFYMSYSHSNVGGRKGLQGFGDMY